jgi:hypothetical protein
MAVYRPNGHKIYQLQDSPRFTQIGIFDLKIIWQPCTGSDWWQLGESLSNERQNNVQDFFFKRDDFLQLVPNATFEDK